MKKMDSETSVVRNSTVFAQLYRFCPIFGKSLKEWVNICILKDSFGILGKNGRVGQEW